MSRLIATLAAVALALGVPAAYAAELPTTPPSAPVTVTVAHPPVTSRLVTLRSTKSNAHAAYVHARRLGHRAGVRVPRQQPAIRRIRRISRVRAVRQLWQRRLGHYRRIIHRQHRVASIAVDEIGAPYAWGGASPRGFDCSGLAKWVYGQVGISLPHYTYSQMRAGRHVTRRWLRPGDLVFTYAGGHVGIYIGGGMIVHAPRPGETVRRTPLSGWSITTIRRIL